MWHVTNAEGSGYGSMTLASATINSVNTVYAQLIQQLGADEVVETAERMGMRCCPRVSEPRAPLSPYLSAVLGTNEANTLEMASAYGTLATGGAHVDPVPVISVTDAQGETLWQAHPDPKQVLEPQVADGRERHPAGCRELRHRDARRSSGGRRSARPARPRPTRTRGSWARSPS